MLNGKTALVTGGSRGIGRAIALKLASQGADIAVIYAAGAEKAQQICDEITAMGRHAAAFQCDVADFAQVKQTVAAVKAEFGGVDILVNNAGITRDGLLAMMKESDYDDVVDTNLKGAFNFIRHCCPLMMKKRSGKIINITSVSGILGTLAFCVRRLVSCIGALFCKSLRKSCGNSRNISDDQKNCNGCSDHRHNCS